MEPVKLAVIGAGAIGRKHVELIAHAPEAKLVGLADPAPAAADLARTLGVPHFADAAALLDATAPDGVVIASPNALHLPHGLAAIERGIPALIEKPIAHTLDAAQALVAASERARVPILVGHHRRYNPIVRAARDAVHGGRLGRVVSVACLYLFLKPDDYFDIAWHREPGAGPVLINLIHDIDTLRFILGEIASVQATTSNATRGLVVEDTAALVLRFASGALGSVIVSDTAAAPWSWELTSGESSFFPHLAENETFIAGTEGALSVPKLELWRYAGARGWSQPLIRERIEIVPADPLVEQLRHFCRVVRRAEPPAVSGADATRTLEATLAVHRSAASGHRIEL
jgi:predicted dehydrogenase